MSDRRRVVVTGVGVISSLAHEAKGHLDGLLHGRSGVKLLDRPEFRHFPCQLGATVDAFDLRKKVTQRMLRKLLTPSAALAVISSGEALRDSGLNAETLARSGIYVGSLSLDVDPNIFIPALKASLDDSGEFDVRLFAQRGTSLLDPLFLVKLLPNGAICGISIEHRLHGSNCNITNGTTSALQAVIHGAAAIRRGEVDALVAGGYDSLLHVETVIEHEIAGRLSRHNDSPQTACRPFDRECDGFVLGEGAAFVTLESASHAERRGARIYGELLGAGMSTDNDVFTGDGTLTGRALAQAAQGALSSGGCGSDEVEVVFGDGLADDRHDQMEIDAFHRMCAGRDTRFTAAGGSLGYAGAATGAFSLVHAVTGLKSGVIAPLINCESPRAGCDLPIVHETQHTDFTRAMVWSSDSGAKNAALLLGTYA